MSERSVRTLRTALAMGCGGAGLTVAAHGCVSAPMAATGAPVTRHFLSGDANDWEPSIAVGPSGAVVVIAGRRIAPPGAAHPLGESHIVTWASGDGGTTFRPANTFTLGGGDERIAIDRRGTLYASWIRAEWDSAGHTVDPTKGGLVVAVSRDGGASWRPTVVATLASGVADKPELAVSPDGRDLYLAFMARGTLDVVASHDSGATWERHTADSTRAGHWPSGIALAPNGTLWIVNVRQAGDPHDSVLRMAVELLQSHDRDATWHKRTLASATRAQRLGACPHAPRCPVQIAYPTVAVDAKNRVSVAYTTGAMGETYALLVTRSDDGGATWSSPEPISRALRPVSGDAADHYYPMLAAAGDGLVYAVWFDDRRGPIDVWARRSTNGGRAWGDEVMLSPNNGLTGIYG